MDNMYERHTALKSRIENFLDCTILNWTKISEEYFRLDYSTLFYLRYGAVGMQLFQFYTRPLVNVAG